MQQVKKGQVSPIAAAFEAEEMVSPDVSKALGMIDEALTSSLEYPLFPGPIVNEGNGLRNRTSAVRLESIHEAQRVAGMDMGPSVFSEMMTSRYGDYLKRGGHRRCLYCGVREGTYYWSHDCHKYAVMVPDDEEDW